MILFLLNIFFGILCFYFLKELRQLLFLLFMNKLYPIISKSSRFISCSAIFFSAIIMLYFSSILITISTILVCTIIDHLKNSSNEIETHPKKLILLFPIILVVFFMYYIHCIFFCEHNFQYLISFLFLFDAFLCAFYKIASQFLLSKFNENFQTLLKDLPEMNNVLEIHKMGILKFVSHLNNFSDLTSLRAINSVPEKVKRIYSKKFERYDLVYFYYIEKSIFIFCVLLGVFLVSAENSFNNAAIFIFVSFHIDWVSFKREKYEMGNKKKFLKKVFMMILYKFLFVVFSFFEGSSCIGYFIFFTLENLRFIYASKINSKVYLTHFACGLILLFLTQRIAQGNLFEFKASQMNVLIFISNIFLVIIGLIKRLKITKIISENYATQKYKLFSSQSVSLITEYFIQESAILVCILMVFFLTLDVFLTMQLIYILSIWILMRYIYENLKLNDFQIFGSSQKIKLKYEGFQKILAFYDAKSKESINLESISSDDAKNLAGFFLSFKKHQKNLLFHQFNKVGDFNQWIKGKLIGANFLITDERIILSGKYFFHFKMYFILIYLTYFL